MGLRTFLSSLLLLVSTPAFASGLDIEAWLEKPGVKLLAVEFYATWCKPCMEAVPKWKALHEKYRKQGLRLVVVSTQDPGGVCANPGWAPDETVCDLDGSVANAFGAGESLPAAFLWGWQGHQLVGKGHVEDVEAAIESWMRDAPRVDVSVGELKGVKLTPEALRRLVVDEVGRSGKLVVVASEAERKKLAELKKRQFEAGFDEKLQCEVGRELPANSMLEATVVQTGGRSRLSLALHDAQSGCLSASALTDLDLEYPDRAVAEALATLVSKTRTEAQLPGRVAPKPRKATPKPVASGTIEETAEEWAPEASREALVTFTSSPPGAVVIVDGELLCQSTPCTKSLGLGRHSVVMQKERYEKRSERLEIKGNAKTDWKLEPAFGLVSVTSEPSGLAVYVDGERVGTTPLSDHALDPGNHEVWVEDRCFLKKGERFGLNKGESKPFRFSPKARESAIDVKAEDAEGNAAEADVYVDDGKVGTTPGAWKVWLCAEKVEVRSSEGSFEDTLSLEERKTTKVKAMLGSKRGGSGGGKAGKSGDMVLIPAGEFWMGCSPRDSSCGDDEKPGRKVYLDAFYIDRNEVTVGQYDACVSAACQRGPGNSGGADHPVVNVDWNQAKVFCEWKGGALPTEAQWEKAARGTDGRIYAWGDEKPTCARANSLGCGGATKPVGSHPAGANGLFDMTGNVWEWVEDVYDEQAYSRLGARNPVSRSRGSFRVSRGGGWLSDGRALRAADRSRDDRGTRGGSLGFRCVRPFEP